MVYLIIYFKVYKNNLFISITNSFGLILKVINSGCLGFKHSKKRTIISYNLVLSYCSKFIYFWYQDLYIFFKIAGIQKTFLQKLYLNFYTSIKVKNLWCLGFKIINKVSHGGCRISKKYL